MEHVHAVVIGGGQAGLATSHELTVRGVEHVVLEAGRIGETWRTRRWRSFRIVSPNQFTHLPGFPFGGDPDAFAATDELVDYLERYAASFGAPVRPGVRVVEVRRAGDGPGYLVGTSAGMIACDAVVVATGAFGHAHAPSVAAQVPPGIRSIHTDEYWAPEDLDAGGVLVVGAGQSGLQIAYELLGAGRAVTLAVGRHGWIPRRLHGRDQNWWRRQNGDFARIVADPAAPTMEYPFTPLSRWGVTDFNPRTVWQAGARFTGHLLGFDGTVARCAPDLRELLAAGDEYATTFIGRIDEFARARGEDVAEHPRDSHWQPGEMPDETTAVDLAAEGIRTVIWSTGYRQDFSWIRVAGVLAPNGAPYGPEGPSPVRGIYFVGLHRQWESATGTLLGAGWRATPVAETIATRMRGS